MISQRVRSTLESIAYKILPAILPLQQTQGLIIKNNIKLDRIDVKLNKEAEKINQKEYLSEVKCQGTRPNKRKGSITYKSYTIDFKKKLIASIREEIRGNNENLSKIIRERARELQIHPKNITRWYHTKQLKKKEGGRKALYPEMEVRLANFILNNPSMRRKHILQQAKQIMEELNIPGREDFNFSKGWYERFRQRLNKSKVFAEVKTDDSVKYEIKLEHLKYNDDEVKIEDDSNDYTEQSFVSEEDSFDYEDEVKLEQDLSQEDKVMISCHQMATRNRSQKDLSLFFDEDEEGPCNNYNKSLLNILDMEKGTNSRLTKVVK